MHPVRPGELAHVLEGDRVRSPDENRQQDGKNRECAHGFAPAGGDQKAASHVKANHRFKALS
jgi:hypothetical protein